MEFFPFSGIPLFSEDRNARKFLFVILVLLYIRILSLSMMMLSGMKIKNCRQKEKTGQRKAARRD
jgi:hypothetical protein